MPDKEFKALVIKLLTKLGKRVDTFNENVNRELENRKNKIQSEMNTRAEVKKKSHIWRALTLIQKNT